MAALKLFQDRSSFNLPRRPGSLLSLSLSSLTHLSASSLSFPSIFLPIPPPLPPRSLCGGATTFSFFVAGNAFSLGRFVPATMIRRSLYSVQVARPISKCRNRLRGMGERKARSRVDRPSVTASGPDKFARQVRGRSGGEKLPLFAVFVSAGGGGGKGNLDAARAKWDYKFSNGFPLVNNRETTCNYIFNVCLPTAKFLTVHPDPPPPLAGSQDHRSSFRPSSPTYSINEICDSK